MDFWAIVRDIVLATGQLLLVVTVLFGAVQLIDSKRLMHRDLIKTGIATWPFDGMFTEAVERGRFSTLVRLIGSGHLGPKYSSTAARVRGL